MSKIYMNNYQEDQVQENPNYQNPNINPNYQENNTGMIGTNMQPVMENPNINPNYQENNTGMIGTNMQPVMENPNTQPGMGDPNTQLGMQPGMNTGMNTGMEPGTDINMQPGMQPGMEPGTDINMQPGMQPGMNTSMESGTDINMQPGMNTGMEPGMNTGMNTGMEPGTDINMQPGMGDPNTQFGMQPGMQPGMEDPNTQFGMQSGMQPGMQPGMEDPNTQFGMQPGMGDPNTQFGMNTNMNTNMDPFMNTGMNTGMEQNINLNQPTMNTMDTQLYNKLYLKEVDFDRNTTDPDKTIVETSLRSCFLNKNTIQLTDFYDKKFFILLNPINNDNIIDEPFAFFTATLTSNENGYNYVTMWDVCKTSVGSSDPSFDSNNICYMLISKYREYLNENKFYKIKDNYDNSRIQYSINAIHTYVNATNNEINKLFLKNLIFMKIKMIYKLHKIQVELPLHILK